MVSDRRYDEPERLNEEARLELEHELRALGPWVYGVGTGGVHTAQRLGTHPQQQSSLTARGLLEAVAKREKQLQEAVPVHTGLAGTERD